MGIWNGGRLAYLVACRPPDVKAVVSYYGQIIVEGISDKRPVPLLELTVQLRPAVLLVWGKDGQPQTLAEVRTLEDCLRAGGKQFDSQVYAALRGLHNPNIAMYHAADARDAGQRTLVWFERYLGASTPRALVGP
jgi:dienelactone hydrolase